MIKEKRICPECGCDEAKVVNVTVLKNGSRRRRFECCACFALWHRDYPAEELANTVGAKPGKDE